MHPRKRPLGPSAIISEGKAGAPCIWDEITKPSTFVPVGGREARYTPRIAPKFYFWIDTHLESTSAGGHRGGECEKNADKPDADGKRRMLEKDWEMGTRVLATPKAAS